MNKYLTLAMASLSLMSCTTKPAASSADGDASDSSATTSIVWIEDKPGPTMQEQRIFPTVPDSLWQALGLQDGVPSSMSCFLLRTEDQTILFDAGLGASFSQLIPKLEAEGVKPEELSLIYITHMHPDHIGGLLSEGNATFPNAQLWINEVEAKAWSDMEDERASQPKAVLEVYSEQLHLFAAGDTLPGGVQTIAAYGHTPGHTVFQKGEILIIADLMHGAALQLQHPEYCPFFDMDPEAATESRIRILEYARQNGFKMYGMHLPDPGFVE